MAGRFADYLERCHAAHVCNGTYLVARDGVPIYVGGVGDAGDPQRTALTAESAFDIGSISKQFTSMAVLRLVGEGRLSLEDHVSILLPEFPYPEITVAQLMTHTSGVPEVLQDYTAVLRSGDGVKVTGEDVVQVLVAVGRPLDYVPGSRHAYNNTGYLVLAKIVETVSGRAFGDYLDEVFFKPLDMTSTRLRTPDTEDEIVHRAFGFQPRAGADRRAMDQIPSFYIRGAGGLYSTVGDLLLWENALNAGEVVPLDVLRQATEPTRLSDGTTVPYGFGLSLKPDLEGVRRVSHGGHWRAFKSDLSFYPDTNLTVIQMTNNAEDDSVDGNVSALAAIAQGRTPVMPKASIQWEVNARLGDADALRDWFIEEVAAQPSRYEIRESELITLGYRLLETRNPAGAVVVLELSTLAFPQSANAFDSLADAQEAMGDPEAALMSVRRALALEPEAASIRAHSDRLAAVR